MSLGTEGFLSRMGSLAMLTERSLMPNFHLYRTSYAATKDGIISLLTNAIYNTKWHQTYPLPPALCLDVENRRRGVQRFLLVMQMGQKFGLMFIGRVKRLRSFKKIFKRIMAWIFTTTRKCRWLLNHFTCCFQCFIISFLEVQTVECYCLLTIVWHMERLRRCL